MARLPQSLDAPAPAGERPSLATVRPTSFGLEDAARAVDKVADAKATQDDKTAAQILQKAQADFEPRFAERAAAYDGRTTGFARQAIAAADDHLTPTLMDKSLPEGVRLSLSRMADRYKANLGARAIGVEAEKRGGIIAEQRKVVEAQGVSTGLTAFQQTFGTGYQALTDALDGSTADHAPKAMALFDDAKAKALEATPEESRAALELRLEAQRPTVLAGAMEAQDKAHDAFVVTQVQNATSASANSVMTDPAGYGMALANADAVVAGLPKALQAPYLDQYKGQLAIARISGLLNRNDFAQADAEISDGRYAGVLKPEQLRGLTAAVRGHAAKMAADMLEASQYGVDPDPQTLGSAVAVSKDPGLAARADWVEAVGASTPGALAGLGGGAKGFREAADFVIDDLEGGEGNIGNDNGKGLSRYGINQAANPDIDVKTMTRAQAVGRYKKYWKAVDADRLPPGLGVVAFDAAVLFGPDDANRWKAQSNGDPGAFLALERAEMQRLATADPAKYGDDLKGWLNRTKKVQAEAARRQAFANVQEGVTSDPIKFALGGNGHAPLAVVPPLPQEAAGPGFQAALRGRLQVGQMMNTTYRAPLRMLTDGEAALFKDQIARDPAAALSFAEEATAAVGPKYARALLGEIGQQGEAGVHLHLADLHAAGSIDFARRAETGLALKAKGSALAPVQVTALKDTVEGWKAVFTGAPELRQVVLQTAEAAMLADSQAGEPKSASAYVDAALGATRRGGKMYGGLVSLNDQVTVLPTWLAKDQADDAMEHLANGWVSSKTGPIYSDGSPIPANKIGRLRVQLQPDGRYRLVNGNGAAAQAKGGGVFSFDFDAARDGLRRIMGQAAVQ